MDTYKIVDGKLEITSTATNKEVKSRDEIEREKEMLEQEISNLEDRIAKLDALLSECTKLKI